MGICAGVMPRIPSNPPREFNPQGKNNQKLPEMSNLETRETLAEKAEAQRIAWRNREGLDLHNRHVDLRDPVERAEARRVAWLRWNKREAEREVDSWFTGAAYTFRFPKEEWLNVSMHGEPFFLVPPSGGSGVRKPKQQ